MTTRKRRKKNRNRLIKWAGIFFMIAGVFFVLMPAIARHLYYQSAEEAVNALEQKIEIPPAEAYVKIDYATLEVANPHDYTAKEMNEAQEATGIFDGIINSQDEEPADQDSQQATEPDKSPNEKRYLLVIPSIHLKVSALCCPSFSAVYRYMRKGAAIFPGAPTPDEIGNICMSAHRTGSKDYFRHLDQIALGDEIFMYGTDNVSYRYKVVDIEIIEPNDWSVTDSTDYPALTLLSCQEFQGVSHGRRIMIRAQLDSKA